MWGTTTVFLAAKNCCTECHGDQRIVVINQLLCVPSLFGNIFGGLVPPHITKHPSNSAD